MRMVTIISYQQPIRETTTLPKVQAIAMDTKMGMKMGMKMDITAIVVSVIIIMKAMTLVII